MLSRVETDKSNYATKCMTRMQVQLSLCEQVFCVVFFLFFRDNADDSIVISENAWLCLVFFFDFNSPCQDSGRRPYLVGNVLNTQHRQRKYLTYILIFC